MKKKPALLLVAGLLCLVGYRFGFHIPGKALDSKALILTSDNFDETIQNSKVPVMVDFWAPWCGPCRRMEPVIEELVEEFEGRAVIAKLNTDDHPDIAGRYGLPGLPAFGFFKDGKAVTGMAGARPKEQLAAQLDVLLAETPPATQESAQQPGQ